MTASLHPTADAWVDCSCEVADCCAILQATYRRLVRIRQTVPVPKFVTQTEPNPTFVDPGSSPWRRFTFQLPQSLGERGVVDGDDVAPRGLQGVDPAGLDS